MGDFESNTLTFNLFSKLHVKKTLKNEHLSKAIPMLVILGKNNPTKVPKIKILKSNWCSKVNGVYKDSSTIFKGFFIHSPAFIMGPKVLTK